MKHAAIPILAIVMIVDVGLALPTKLPGELSIVGLALADDDDDDDDDGSRGTSFDDAVSELLGTLGRVLGLDSGEGAGGGAESFEPDEVLAVNADAAAVARATALGFTVLSRQRLPSIGVDVVRFRVPSNLDAISGRQLLRRETTTGQYDLNHIYRSARRTCPDARCYGPTMVRWHPTPSACPTRLRVGLVDAAVDLGHPALRGRPIATRSFTPKGRAQSGSAHGTAVAALLFGKPGTEFAELIPGARAFAADVFYREDGGQDAANAASIVEGLDWLAAQTVTIINFSIAGADNLALGMAIDRLGRKGVLLVAAAGNDGPRAAPAYSAAHANVIAVTAVDSELKLFRRANRGPYMICPRRASASGRRPPADPATTSPERRSRLRS